MIFSKILLHSGLQTRNFIKKRLQHRCFPVNIAKFLGIAILKNICQQLFFRSWYRGNCSQQGRRLDVMKNFAKFIGNICIRVPFVKVAGLQSAKLLEKDSSTDVFLWDFTKPHTSAFSSNTSVWLLLLIIF